MALGVTVLKPIRVADSVTSDQTAISLFLERQSDHCLHCLLFHHQFLTHIKVEKLTCPNVRIITKTD